jgi:diguanylate cyclase (GGDEF)-like protein
MDTATLPVRGRVHRAAVVHPPTHLPDIALVGDRPLSASARRAVLAAALSLPAESLRNLGPVETARALNRLFAMAERVRRLQEEAAVDDLTGVLRRGAGLRLVQAEVDRVRRGSGRLVLVFVDLDGLKRINDSLGHAAGDRMLRLVARTLRRRLRSYDLVIRWGGDEFLCVLSGAGMEEAQAKLEQVAGELHAEVGEQAISFGLAALDVADPKDDAMALVGRADAELYRGRARVRRAAR